LQISYRQSSIEPLSPDYFSLYIHFPWCVSKCPYCDFNSHAGQPMESYIQCLLDDFDRDIKLVSGRTLKTIFMGGGTPSLFSSLSINRLLEHIKNNCHYDPDLEITLEANPGTVDEQSFEGYRQAGVNRLSIGVQSFNDVHLNSIGRIHDAKKAFNAIKKAQQAGFDNINIDLMMALPSQSLNEAKEDVYQAIDCKVRHLSHYHLTVEPHTAFSHSPPSLPSHDESFEMQQQCQQILSESGYKQYEVSAFCLTDQQCLHNVNYWQFGDYLGIGAGAHGKVTLDDGAIQRYWKKKSPADFMNNEVTVAGSSVLDKSDIFVEFMMNALRLERGFSELLFSQRTGLDQMFLQKKLQSLIDDGLINYQKSHVSLTSQGKLFLDQILSELL
jgi:putative oxygen-independent coproporphyrinogen III oxidase